MQLNTLFSNLSFGELSNLAIGGDGSGVIPQEHRPKLVAYTNQSLKVLFSRFNLLERELVLQQDSGITNYPLHVKYAVSANDPTVAIKYINDSGMEPFTGDLVKIQRLFDELGEELPVNDPTQVNSLYIPQFDVVQIPEPVDGNSTFVMYQATHKVIIGNIPDEEINIPPVLEMALQAHVAYRVFSGMNGPEHLAKSQEQLQRYEMICQMTDQKDLANSSLTPSNHRFENRGWV